MKKTIVGAASVVVLTSVAIAASMLSGCGKDSGNQAPSASQTAPAPVVASVSEPTAHYDGSDLFEPNRNVAIAWMPNGGGGQIQLLDMTCKLSVLSADWKAALDVESDDNGRTSTGGYEGCWKIDESGTVNLKMKLSSGPLFDQAYPLSDFNVTSRFPGPETDQVSAPATRSNYLTRHGENEYCGYLGAAAKLDVSAKDIGMSLNYISNEVEVVNASEAQKSRRIAMLTEIYHTNGITEEEAENKYEAACLNEKWYATDIPQP